MLQETYVDCMSSCHIDPTTLFKRIPASTTLLTRASAGFELISLDKTYEKKRV